MPSREEVDRLAVGALARWRPNPVLFGEEVLGLAFWHKQREILESVERNEYTCVRSGHKCGKTTTAAEAAWWWASTRPRALVLLTAPSYTQVEDILWAEVSRLHSVSKMPLGGKLSVRPEGGWEGPGKSGPRRIIGFSTDKPERAAGFSGPNTLIIIDEASGFDEKIFEALRGNMAGGAKILALSNPTQTSGWYHDAFHNDGSPWNQIHMSSRECAESWPTELGERGQGLATLSWCDTLLKEYGPTDPRYLVRVLGDFPTEGSDTMIPQRVAKDAAARREQPSGKLQLGVDPARFGTDQSAIVAARGNWSSRAVTLNGCDNVEVAAAVLKVINDHRISPTEKVSVRIDTSNNGGGVKDILRHGPDKNIELIEIVASAKSPSEQHSRLRDHVWSMLRTWLDRGAIADDPKMIVDVSTPKLGFDEKGKIKVESKKEMRRRIGRSTDRADALAMAVYPADTSISDHARRVLSDRYRTDPSRM